MKFILGKKQNMTQVFDVEGYVHPVTVLAIGPMVVTQIKDVTKDGYKAVQIGYGTRNPKNINKAQIGHMKTLGNFATLKEFPVEDTAAYKVGDAVTASSFAEGDVVEVTAVSKGKGFQGVVKRHGFAGGPRTHGQKHSEREPGSIGGSGGRAGGRVAKNMRMAGRMGGDRVTVTNLKVMKVDVANNQIMIKGAIPGRRGTLVEVRG